MLKFGRVKDLRDNELHTEKMSAKLRQLKELYLLTWTRGALNKARDDGWVVKASIGTCWSIATRSGTIAKG